MNFCRALKRAKKIEERRKRMMERPYYIDFGTFRLITHKLVTSKYFDLGISAVIGLNVITMAMEFYMMPQVIYKLYQQSWDCCSIS